MESFEHFTRTDAAEHGDSDCAETLAADLVARETVLLDDYGA
jgi:hypothetical protein